MPPTKKIISQGSDRPFFIFDVHVGLTTLTSRLHELRDIKSRAPGFFTVLHGLFRPHPAFVHIFAVFLV